MKKKARYLSAITDPNLQNKQMKEEILFDIKADIAKCTYKTETCMTFGL